RNMEYLRKRADYNQCLDASEQDTTGDCEEPEPDYDEAQELYKEILAEHPDYSRLDEVLYRFGRGLIEDDEGPEAVKYLQQLVKDYPNSKYRPNAHLELGEFFFGQEMLGAAEDNYEEVLEYEDNDNYDFALYKLGWVHYNKGEYRKSIERFQAVVEQTDDTLGFQNQAINDLVLAYGEIDNGWKEMRDYFIEERDKEFAYKQLGRLAELYEQQGKNNHAIAVYEYFIDERPDHQRVPEWAESIIAAKKDEKDFEDLEKTINEYVNYMDPDSTWARKNEDNEGALGNAELVIQAGLGDLANTYHRRAQREENKDDYRSAIKYYKEFIDRFPDEPIAFDMNFFVADIYLLELDNFEDSARYYQRVVDLYKNDNVPDEADEDDVEAMVKDSAYGVVNAYNELVKEHHEDSILVEMAEYQEEHGAGDFKKEEVDDATDTEPNEKQDMRKYEEGFVKASDQYSEMYPDDDITPTVDFVAAEVYKERGHYDKCIPRYENIIENAGDHRYASYAGGSLLVANYVLENWDEVERWARHMMDNEIFDVTPKEELKQAIALAINERAKEYEEAEEFDKATDELLALAEEFPDSDLAPGALFNAGAIYESGDDYKRAVEVYTQVIEDYPKNKRAPEALFVMGAIYQTRADFEQAADYFARLGSEDDVYKNDDDEEVPYKDHPKAADAVYNSAYLLDNMEKWQPAIDAYEKYIDLYGDQEDQQDEVREVELLLPYLDMEVEDWESALERLEKFAERDDVKDEEVVLLNSEMGVLVEKIEGPNWEDESDDLFDKALEAWDELDEEKQHASREFAAQARFHQAERIFEDFNEVKLEFPMATLQDRLKKKGEHHSKAEKIYREIIDMGHEKWLAASAFRIGQMYRDFAEQLTDLPLPDGLTPEQEQEYQFVLDEKILPLEEQAIDAFRYAQERTIEFQAYNDWSARSAEQISDMESEAYPVTKQEGVAVEHSRINFSVPDPNVDMDAVADRVEKRKKLVAEPSDLDVLDEMEDEELLEELGEEQYAKFAGLKDGLSDDDEKDRELLNEYLTQEDIEQLEELEKLVEERKAEEEQASK
ncbi:MAG: tetratricopeptide repeat protein, partial [Persicimonas sp.]